MYKQLEDTEFHWKTEPVSPFSNELDAQLFDDYTLAPPCSTVDLTELYDDGNADASIITEDVPCNDNGGQTKAEIAGKLLDDLNHLDCLDQWIKDESLPFTEWLEEKMDMPIYSEYQHLNNTTVSLHQLPDVKTYMGGPAATPNNIQQQHLITQNDATQSLLQEFESVFGEIELTHSTLTPPQSPPENVFTNLQPIQYGDNLINSIYENDVAKELAIVDEIVRSHAEGITDTWEDSSQGSSLPLSPSTSFSGSEESTDDSESNSKPSRKRGKPYDRTVIEDKKSRKKEQNKNAATRYRQKKKAEVEVILNEEKGLEDVQSKLKVNVADLTREVKYLKGLMRDLFVAKGVLKG